MSKDYTEILDKLAEQIKETDRLKKSNTFLKTAGENLVIHNKELQAENAKLKGPILELVEEQAKDEGIWFLAKTAPEAYLQNELRKLHAAIGN